MLCSTPFMAGQLPDALGQLPVLSEKPRVPDTVMLCGVQRRSFQEILGRNMWCNLGPQHACHGFNDEHNLRDPTSGLRSRGAGLPLTNLKRWYVTTAEGSTDRTRVTVRAAEPNRVDDRGTLADALLGSLTQTLVLSMSAASVASGSLARLQRIIGPLPSGFPPGVALLHAGDDIFIICTCR